MSTINQIKGMLLEEALVPILTHSGYNVLSPRADLTNENVIHNKTGFFIEGRGARHQIDVIAHPLFPTGFLCNTRMLLEAKSSDERVGLEIVRNALGTQRDLEEYWRGSQANDNETPRYHYRYAIASAEGFTAPAQRYAYAHDISLISLEKNGCFGTVMQAIEDVLGRLEERRDSSGSNVLLPVSLADYRSYVRDKIEDPYYCDADSILSALMGAIQDIKLGVIAYVNQGFPILLTPANESAYAPREDGFATDGSIRIRKSPAEGNWVITDTEDTPRYSFDLPEKLFKAYSENNVLSQQSALVMKANHFGTVQYYVQQNNRIELKTFHLDNNWIQELLMDIDHENDNYTIVPEG